MAVQAQAVVQGGVEAVRVVVVAQQQLGHGGEEPADLKPLQVRDMQFLFVLVRVLTTRTISNYQVLASPLMTLVVAPLRLQTVAAPPPLPPPAVVGSPCLAAAPPLQPIAPPPPPPLRQPLAPPLPLMLQQHGESAWLQLLSSAHRP